MADRDYVLGTDEDEMARLGVQHLVWRPRMLDAWRRAGITRGSRVIDVGAGPGYATADLSEIVGSGGEVVAVERSARFVQAARDRCARRGLPNLRISEMDLMQGAIDAVGADAAWCRWVACFVSSPATLVGAIALSLRPGGVAVFHEYADYASWRLLPARRSFDTFVAEVMASWRDTGGEPDIALTLPSLLHASGFRVRHVTPLVFAAHPSDFIWQWPSTFLKSHVPRLRELGRGDAAWAATVLHDFEEAERDPATIMLTPLVLEIVAEKEGVQRTGASADSISARLASSHGGSFNPRPSEFTSSSARNPGWIVATSNSTLPGSRK
jgi:protein-L-isoaspartate O-methyltransferase